MRVLIVDEQRLIRVALRRILEGGGAIRVVGECAERREVAAALDELSPDVVVIDLRLTAHADDGPGGPLNGGPAPWPPILLLAPCDEPGAVRQALGAGVKGVVRKEASDDDIVRATETVGAGKTWIDPQIAGDVIATYRERDVPADEQRRATAALTQRERDVLRLVGRGASNADIARELFIGEATVKSHLSNVLVKLDLRDRMAAIVYAFDHGLVQPRWIATGGARSSAAEPGRDEPG